jgi:hypothetical protein
MVVRTWSFGVVAHVLMSAPRGVGCAAARMRVPPASPAAGTIALVLVLKQGGVNALLNGLWQAKRAVARGWRAPFSGSALRKSMAPCI